MRMLLALTFSTIIAATTVGAVFACDEDILCPDRWVWSDKEGTCVEAPLPSLSPVPNS